ncbi:hypothetical protein [Acidisoma sp. 7E03]
MNPPMRRAATVSAALHLLLLAALILSLPTQPPKEAPDLAAVSVDFVGPTDQVRQSDLTGKTAAPDKTATTVDAPKATQQPTPQPLSDAPPPPPPPPPPPSETPTTQPPVPTPPPPAPAPPAPPTPETPTPAPARTPTTPSPPPPEPQTAPSPDAEPLPPPPPPQPTPPKEQTPPKPETKPTPAKPTPPKAQPTPQTQATPTPPSKTQTEVKPAPQTQADATPALPMPPPPAPPAPPAPVSPTTQPHPTQNPTAMSQTVLNTLDKLRSMNLNQKSPTSRYNPQQGGAPDAGGQRTGDATSRLTAAQRGAIGQKIEGCWFIDGGAPNVQQLSVLLQVKTRPGGEVYDAQVAPQDLGRVNSDPVLEAFALRARNAAMDAKCNPLPLPPSLQNAPQTFTIRFKP